MASGYRSAWPLDVLRGRSRRAGDVRGAHADVRAGGGVDDVYAGDAHGASPRERTVRFGMKRAALRPLASMAPGLHHGAGKNKVPVRFLCGGHHADTNISDERRTPCRESKNPLAPTSVWSASAMSQRLWNRGIGTWPARISSPVRVMSLFLEMGRAASRCRLGVAGIRREVELASTHVRRADGLRRPEWRVLSCMPPHSG